MNDLDLIFCHHVSYIKILPELAGDSALRKDIICLGLLLDQETQSHKWSRGLCRVFLDHFNKLQSSCFKESGLIKQLNRPCHSSLSLVLGPVVLPDGPGKFTLFFESIFSLSTRELWFWLDWFDWLIHSILDLNSHSAVKRDTLLHPPIFRDCSARWRK